MLRRMTLKFYVTVIFMLNSIVFSYMQDKSYWYEQATDQLLKNLRDDRNHNMAKNLILFIGDGMGITTVTAARIFGGQKKGQAGEDHELTFEKFQHVALAKTYNIDSQIGNSGGCATALLCGVKGRFKTIGLDVGGFFNDCQSSIQSRIPSLADWAQEEGKSTGLVTTARLTDATPAALYSHSANRYWESDDNIPEGESFSVCKDIARQLVEDEPGRNINVILGGGRRHFLPNRNFSKNDSFGRRIDGRNLIDAWKTDKKVRGFNYKYVWKKEDFDHIDPAKTDYLLGIFNNDHMAYEIDRNSDLEGEPSLADMTKKSIQILRKNPEGYLLVVEGGRIDHSHHSNNARGALEDALALDEAVSTAIQMTKNWGDTLVVVTSDHSSVFAFGGYPRRGNSILGMDNKVSDVDNMPYTTLLYANGPGYNYDASNGRKNITGLNTG